MAEEDEEVIFMSVDGNVRHPWSPRKVAAASMVGTTIEYYDFFIYSTAAALVLGRQFFPNASPTAGTLAAFATLSAGFIARPLGGIVMGHYGDKIGRKKMLMLSLLIMGVATALIGVLPDYGAIGLAAPIALVVLRFAQGFGVGGEIGGAVLLSFEHAPRRQRALFGALPMMGLPLGVLLSMAVFLVMQNLVPGDAFASWGWRVPFLLAVLIVAVGILLRRKALESPEFTAAKVEGELRKMPLVELVRTAPKELVIGSVAMIAAPTLGYLIQVYMIAYSTSVLELPNSTMLWVIMVGCVVWMSTVPVAGALADRFGRKPVFVAGTVLAIAWAFPLFTLMNTRSLPLMLVAEIVASLSTAMITGIQGAILSEAFPPNLRYSGLSVTVQVGTLLGGAVAPLAATALLAATGTTTSISLYMVGVSLLSLVAVLALNTSPTRYAPSTTATKLAAEAAETALPPTSAQPASTSDGNNRA
ncbi:MHS family MFS transporter [Saccharopolyspora sp. K220]|uniref:MFS transporter n=1 Tax=Saccharopolyspora soli TaxID=2926618 RepID=UPI001F59C678|nr:MFS transporter [Saccharopolyspora soli]MCI2421450.1 MHS family MFS transporter [Saccharopolyspora soli]